MSQKENRDSESKSGGEENGRLSRLEHALGYRFEDRSLLARALIHRSFAHESETSEHNEPLEFLGDAVLGFLVAERVFRRRSDLDEGGMTRLRAALVNMNALAAEAVELDLGAALGLGVGEERSGGREKPSLLADAYEAVIGAIYLDGGIRAVRSIVTRRFRDRIASGASSSSLALDAKTKLQEYVQSRGWPLPDYRLADQRGPDHARSFTIEVLIRGEVCGRGEGSSKKSAEQAAAASAVQALKKAKRKNSSRD